MWGRQHRELNLVAGENRSTVVSVVQTGLPERYFKMAPGTERAWTGSNPYVRKVSAGIRALLYKTTFDNPQPEVKISTVDFVSTETIACPFSSV